MIAVWCVAAGSIGSVFSGLFRNPFPWQYMERRSGERTIRKLMKYDPAAAAGVLKIQAAERAGRLMPLADTNVDMGHDAQPSPVPGDNWKSDTGLPAVDAGAASTPSQTSTAGKRRASIPYQSGHRRPHPERGSQR
jgi:hypothetical protein